MFAGITDDVLYSAEEKTMGEIKEVRCPKCGAAIRFEFRPTLSADREPEAA